MDQLERLRVPGAALVTVGVVSVVGNLLAFVTHLTWLLRSWEDWIGLSSEDLWTLATGPGLWFVVSLTGFGLSFVVIAAGLALRDARSRGLVVAGSVLAMLPCGIGVPCCCLGMPIGAWVLWVLRDDEVEALFASGAAAPRRARPREAPVPSRPEP